MTRAPATHGRVSRFDLYEWTVQAPAVQARFVEALHGGSPRTLREDFCGPASLARAWAALGAGRRAIGVDRDPEPLAHALTRARRARLGARLHLVRGDARSARGRSDIVAAFNFALCELHERSELLAYLGATRRRLRAGGVLVADLYAGPGSLEVGSTTQRVPTPIGVVSYTWEQRTVSPLVGRVINAMHFRLPGGRRMKDAFVYDWRLWSIGELRDAMLEAGFGATEVYTSYAQAIDGDGRHLVEPADEHEPLAHDAVVYVAARVER